MDNSDYALIRTILHDYQRFVIAGHLDPDGDAIGSGMGLALALHKMGKTVTVVLDAFPEKFHVIPGKQFLSNDKNNALDAEVFIAVDCGDVERLGNARFLFKQIPVTICIDHHETNKGFARYNLIKDDISSTAEVIYDLITPLVELDADIAAALYAGILTDTGGFRFNRTNAATLEKTARLVATGIPYTEIYNELMYYRNFTQVRALGIAYNNARCIADGRVIYSMVTQAELLTAGAVEEDLEGVAKDLITTRGAQVSLFFREGDDPGEVKVSLRSHDFHVGKFAARWGGGGHQLAAGCTVAQPIEQLAAEMLSTLERELSPHVY